MSLSRCTLTGRETGLHNYEFLLYSIFQIHAEFVCHLNEKQEGLGEFPFQFSIFYRTVSPILVTFTKKYVPPYFPGFLYEVNKNF